MMPLAVVTISSDYSLRYLILGDGWEAEGIYLFIFMQSCCCPVSFHEEHIFTLTFICSITE